MVGLLTIFWSELADEELMLLREVTAAPADLGVEQIHLRRVSDAELARVVTPAIDWGAVVLIAADDRAASRGLALGVDEVVRMGSVTESFVQAAVDRALDRAAGRSQRAAQRRTRDASTFSLLAAALGNELGASLTVASTCCEVLSSGLPSMMRASDEMLDWAMTSAPIERVRRLVAVCSAGPDATALSATADDASRSVARAMSIVKTLRELSFDRGTQTVALDESLTEFADMLRAYVSSWARLTVCAESGAVAAVSRSELTWMMATLLASALEDIRVTHTQRADGQHPPPLGKITVTAKDEHECVLVEVTHDGSPSNTSLDRSELQSEELLAVRDQARGVGGELLVDQGPKSVTVRLMLPKGDVETAALRSGWVHSAARTSSLSEPIPD